MTKDYLKIVLDGIIHKNESEYLASYFFREFKVAEKEHYQADEFFNGCLKVAEDFEADIKKQFWERKAELFFMQNGAETGTIDSENPKEIIEYCKTELSELSENDFLFQLRMLPMGGHLSYRQVLSIKDAISEAFQMVKNENAKTLISEPQQTEGNKSIKGLASNFDQIQIGNIFDGLNKGKHRIDLERKEDFLSIFQAKELKNWKPLKWEGTNPELATLIFKLTETEPIPSIVNTFFDPKSTYDSKSKGRGRTNNHAIKQIINNCLK